ncbi:MAG: hypothetical protein A2041_15080 [Bacteroidetes bacterium GWA2_31_9b]|nr:MAG: hypothetical protein A2041_15080 [Bacteroidetes bacterium GWA2_31_9b]
MKIKSISGYLIVIIALFSGCKSISSFQIETINPAQINIPGSFNKIVLINLENDFNDDNVIDTSLYKIVTNELSIGFIDGSKQTPNIDSTNLIFYKQLVDKNLVYKYDTINWKYFDDLNDSYGTDIAIVIDSILLKLDSGEQKNVYTYPEEYYIYREFEVQVFWSVFDIIERKLLDKYIYSDTLIWDASGTSIEELRREFPSVIQSVKEVCYFSALDYSNRIFPKWEVETRYYFFSGNNDMLKAAELVQKDDWKGASLIWVKYVSDIDTEIASRACFNLAVASEIKGNFNDAIFWAQQSYKNKEKPRTRYYILQLKNRKYELEKINKQL